MVNPTNKKLIKVKTFKPILKLLSNKKVFAILTYIQKNDSDAYELSSEFKQTLQNTKRWCKDLYLFGFLKLDRPNEWSEIQYQFNSKGIYKQIIKLINDFPDIFDVTDIHQSICKLKEIIFILNGKNGGDIYRVLKADYTRIKSITIQSGLKQSNVSAILSKMEKLGIVRRSKIGVGVYYEPTGLVEQIESKLSKL